MSTKSSLDSAYFNLLQPEIICAYMLVTVGLPKHLLVVVAKYGLLRERKEQGPETNPPALAQSQHFTSKGKLCAGKKRGGTEVAHGVLRPDSSMDLAKGILS
jgi:hypothetical protein